jgi:Predicted membrane protein (DUF2306)
LKYTSKNIIVIFSLIVLAFFSFLMLRIIWQYIPMRNNTGFLQLKQNYIHITQWRMAFYTHVFSSILVLLAGFTQFSNYLLTNYRRLHKTMGYIYVVNILMVTGPASLLMGFYANGGKSSIVAFVLLAVLWLLFTAIALYKAVKKNFDSHRAFMIRSFALTLSAITLRIWKVIFAATTDIAPMDRYRIIAWLGWVLNLCIAEYIIATYINSNSRFKV